MEKRFNKRRLVIFILVLILLIIGITIGLYFYNISAVNKGKGEVTFSVEQGDTFYSISSKLKENDLIRSEFFYKIYLKIYKPDTLEASEYILNDNMSIKNIIKTFLEGSTDNRDTVTITFPEGKNIRGIAKIIENNTSITYDEVLNKLEDDAYIDSLIEEYWFLTDAIKNKDIYYPLEGYLFPDTYEFYLDVTVEFIFSTMLDRMDTKLSEYKTQIESNKYNIHQIITLASIIELEGASSTDRHGVAGVFYNRLNDGWTMGSDVTTYYAEKIDDWSRKLKMSELNKCNAYNTRGNCVKALPIGPISNPGIMSIESTISPEKHNNYYFVADCTGKTILNKNESSHVATINKLKRENNWCDS